ncbi:MULTISPECIES: TolC family protein [unclassified Sphingomonas]|uniref:TolC family protein n=1 Tax=unclassified Sphingomonas TaxID=196159 RepID=UPI0006FE86A5|nr:MULTISPECIES: TolC family protein [unclassified Sphingomonas]KQX19161.1 transporter [Sphingomonas sp. Root1294]KQY65362.1 transporter [Sphingomonas sp. Root50]KRB95345.1 transporter [Sphingomonas sp. Root720]
MLRVIAALLAVSSCASIAQAQTATSPPSANQPIFSLERARTNAGGTSPSIESAAAGVRSAVAGRTIAGLRPNPEFQVQSENVAGSGPYRGTRSAETTATLALPIELGGKRSARIAVADSRAARAQIDAAIALADLNLRISQTYITAAAAERRVDVARQQASIAGNAFKAARTRVTAGAGAPIDQQRADVLRLNAEVGLERAIREAELARGNLARLVGQPIDGSLDLGWFDRVGGYGPSRPVDPSGTLALAAAQADLNTANAGVRLAKSQRIPDITISAGARRLSETNDTAAVVGIAIPFPVFNNGAAGVSQARAELARADANRRLAIIEAEQAIASAQAELANAAATARSAGGPGLAAAAEAARIARVGYAQGKFSQLDLLEAERTLAETRASFTDALAAYHDAEVRLERLTAPAPEIGGR